MEALIESFNKANISSFSSVVSGYIRELDKRLVKEHNEDNSKWNEGKVIDGWNDLKSDFVVKKGGSRNTDPNAPQCEHIFQSGKHPNTRCQSKVSNQSVTYKYCSRHYKTHEKSEEDGKDKCCYVYTKKHQSGEAGDVCNRNVSQKSKTGKYCYRHLKSEEVKINKADLAKFLNKKINEDDDDETILKYITEAEDIFGFMAIYNMNILVPSIYNDIKELVDIYIEENKNKHIDDIKDFEEKEKKMHSRSSSTASEGDVSRNRSRSSSVGELDTKKETTPRGKINEEKNNEEKEDEEDNIQKKEIKERKPGRPIETKIEDVFRNESDEGEAIDEDVETVKVEKVKEKDSKLFGEKYFFDSKTNSKYLFNPTIRQVYGKIFNGEKVPLSIKDKKRISDYWDFEIRSP